MDPRCQEFRRAVLVGEINASSNPHSLACVACRRFEEAEHATSAMIRRAAPRWQAPAHLRENLAATLDRERERSARVASLRHLAVVVGLTVLLVSGALAMWIARAETTGQHRAHATTDQIVADFLNYARLGPESLEILTRDPAAVERFFAERIRLAAKVPRLSGVTLIGGRQSNLGSRPAALLFFEQRGPGGGEPLSLFVFEPQGEDWSRMPEVKGLPGRRTCHEHKHGVGVLVWEERGLTYALAGALELDQLKGMLPL
jgi:anti-sigma factor RsiW